MVAVVLAGEDVAQVHLDLGGGDGQEGVAQGHGGVAVAAEVDHEAVGGEAGLLDVADELAFDVALVVAYLDVGLLN